jgi:hypothetical protein
VRKNERAKFLPQKFHQGNVYFDHLVSSPANSHIISSSILSGKLNSQSQFTHLLVSSRSVVCLQVSLNVLKKVNEFWEKSLTFGGFLPELLDILRNLMLN